MERAKKRISHMRYGGVFVCLALALLLILILNITLGSVKISLSDIFAILTGRVDGTTEADIILRMRLPRVIMAAVLGGALSLSGFLLQTFFNNPIAGPFVLGISSGAKLIVAIATIFFAKAAGSISSLMMILAAFIGAMISTLFVLLLSKRIGSMSILLVGGIMVGYICSAATDFMITFAEDSDIVNLHNWSMGSFSGMSWSSVSLAMWIIAVVSIIVFLLSKPISAYQMGETYAKSVGVNVQTFKVVLILCSSILSACVTAFAGPISFVGIAVPFLVKKLLGTSRPIIVIPATFLGGAVFCTFCDLIARTLFSPTELAISAVTSVIGAPVVIFMMIKRSVKT